MTWIVAVRRGGASSWDNRGTTEREPTEEYAAELLRGGHVPRFPEAFSEAGMEVRFLPIGGGEAVVYTARYELHVRGATVADADAAALPDLDQREGLREGPLE